MPMYVDTETIGLHGIIVIIQWAEDEGPIHIHEVWRVPIQETIELIEKILDRGIIGFNLAFDWFHLQKLYNTFCLFPDRDAIPEDHIDELAILEEKARDGPCIKPRHCFDLMLHARRGPFQSLMARDDIRIRRVPSVLAYELAKELETRVKIDSVYFSGKKNKFSPRWNTYEHMSHGKPDPDFKDVILKFAPSRSLKTLAMYTGLADNVLLFQDIEVPKKYWADDLGYAPYALAVAKPPTWMGWNKKNQQVRAWPALIKHHIAHWAYNEFARKYATDDIVYTRGLYHYFKDPALDDDDSVLACMVASVRWSGFSVNIEGLKKCRAEAAAQITKAPRAPRQVRLYLTSAMSDTEVIALPVSTKKTVLESVSKWRVDCPDCKGENLQCPRCNGVGELVHPAAKRAKEVLDARKSEKEVELYDKIIRAGRFHASFSVVGTLSNRMAGDNDLNPQAINHSEHVRVNFTFCGDGYTLCGGDMDSYELSLADAIYKDPVMRSDLQSGVKLHAVMGSVLFDLPYEKILASKANKDLDMYDAGKKGNFLLLYGGNENTFENKLGISKEKGLEAFKKFFAKYQVFGKTRHQKMMAYCSMTQPGGIGTKVIWKDPAEYSESLFGYRRYFTIENMICKALFELAQSPPPHWRDVKVKVQRRERIQTASGAVQSALYASAFGLQGANMRAGLNNEIQSSGSTLLKNVQRSLWDVQPVGVSAFIVKPMNIHDEINSPVKQGYETQVEQLINSKIASFKPQVPQLGMKWKVGLKNWAEK